MPDEVKVHRDYETLVFTFADRVPMDGEIDASIREAQGMAGINAVELVLRPEFTNALSGALVGFHRVGSVSSNTTTWLRWRKRFDTPQLSDDDQKIIRMRAGLQ